MTQNHFSRNISEEVPHADVPAGVITEEKHLDLHGLTCTDTDNMDRTIIRSNGQISHIFFLRKIRFFS